MCHVIVTDDEPVFSRIGYHLPDRAQPYLESFGTCPDFAYQDKQTLVYIDGPHHDGNTQKTLDTTITTTLESAGFTVIRFTREKGGWPEILAKNSWVFGGGKTSETSQDGTSA